MQMLAARRGEPTLSPLFALTNTTRSLELTADGFTWAQGNPMVVDQYGKFIATQQAFIGGAVATGFLVSNDSGATWVDPTQTGFSAAAGELYLQRGSIAYDATNDIVHVLWMAQAATDGMIYRRYSITRDGSNNITGFTRIAGINLQVDFENAGTMSYQHPCAHFDEATGTLFLAWASYNAAGVTNKNEIRGTRRVLSNTVADNTAANWSALTAVASTTSIGQSPQVPYTAINVDVGTNGINYPSIGFGAGNNIYVLYSTGASPHSWAYRKLTWDGTNWVVSLEVVICAINRAGATTGYNLKQQLGTSLKYDSTGKMWFGIATKNTGDTWTVGYIDAGTGVVSDLLDVYVAPEAHMSADDFVTGDIMWDSASGRLIVSYTDLPAKHIYGCVVDDTPAVTVAAALWSNARPFDIPTLYEARDNGNIICLVRDFNDAAVNNPPVYTPYYDGYAGIIAIQ